MSWVAGVEFSAWVGGQFHIRTDGDSEMQCWPEWADETEGLPTVGTSEVILVKCRPDTRIRVTVLTLEDLGASSGDWIYSQPLRLHQGRFAVGTVESETAIVIDGRPTEIEMHLYAERSRERFRLALEDQFTGRAAIRPDDPADDLVDIPYPVQGLPEMISHRQLRGPGLPLLVVLRQESTGEQRIVSYRVAARRYRDAAWAEVGVVPATPEGARRSVELSRSVENTLH